MDSKGFKLTVTIDGKNLDDYTVSIDKVTNGLQKEFNELREEYADLKAEYDQRVKELAEISGYISKLAYNYDFKTIPNGAPLHYFHEFRMIANIVGAGIPKAPFTCVNLTQAIIEDA
ncbi:hypothetical protein P5666_22345 [Bacillus subtilis]|nr:hypothetical protein P5666_22345 [Bacillus subtilis]